MLIRRGVSLLVVALVATAALPARAQSPLFVSPDIAANPGRQLGPADVVSYLSGGYNVEFTLPGVPTRHALDGMHRLDRPGSWLFSLGKPDIVGGVAAEPGDIILFDGAGYSLYFDGSAVLNPNMPQLDIDALYIDGADTDDLVISLNIPIEFPAGSGTIYWPADLLRFSRPAGGGPASWTFVGPEFNATAAGVPAGANVIGADRKPGEILLAFSTAATLPTTSGPQVFSYGSVVAYNGAFSTANQLLNWPANSQVDALACQSNPGSLDQAVLRVNQIAGSTDLRLTWGASCSSGADDYAIYEGTIGNYYNHAIKDCSDDGGDRTEVITPSGKSTYYLVVPHNATAEGSYGTDSTGLQRPVGAATCNTTQIVSACP